MSKVFRLYKEGSDTYEGWNENLSFPYNSNACESIEDPDGASAKNEITSIPSPFARIDLVKTAFKEVCKLASKDIKALKGNTIFHKMVSDTLDVGEIFFNIDNYKDKIEIITWDRSLALPALKADGSNGHSYVADALEKYMMSDEQTYHFDRLRNIYLLNYKEGPDELNIIGATSPATLFFSGANDLTYVNDIYFADNDKPFDNSFQPLYARDFDYVKVWWTLRKTIAGFSNLFPELESYLSLTFKAISDQNKKNFLNEVDSKTVKDFATIDAQAVQQNNLVEVLGFNLLKKRNGMDGKSEFTIQPTTDFAGNLPIVLPVEEGNKYADLKYVNGEWGNKNKAPYMDAKPFDQRVLPFNGTSFEYLTISDFMEDTIIKVPHLLNDKFFFDGGITIKDEMTSFLIPLKPLYFKYFSVDTLKGSMPDGKKAFEMECVAAGSVNVTLRIPIVGNGKVTYIEYQRLYYKDNPADISETKNSGGMIKSDFTGLVMPAVKFQKEEEAMYTVSCISTFSGKHTLEFYVGDDQLLDIPMDCRNTIKGVYDYKAETYTIEGHNFDYIRIINDNNGGVLIPGFKTHQNGDTYEFAIDLGTSNTHIEYKKHGERNSKAFEYGKNDAMMCTFFVPTSKDIKGERINIDLRGEGDVITTDFAPESVGGNTNFKFPTRTVLSFAKSIDWKKEQRPFGLANFNIAYNKKANFEYNAKPLVNIKWGSENNSKAAMRAYIKDVMMLIRNKVAAIDGNLADTQIIWFYPNSMAGGRLANFRGSWNEYYEELFNKNGSTNEMSESIAPIRFHFENNNTANNLINIDIGGGTTDVAFSSKNGNVDYITSFKFAANSLFEDSLSTNSKNGIIDWFKDNVYSILSNESGAEFNELSNIYNTNVGQPANMASFLFSLRDNSTTKSLSDDSIDFNKILQNDTKFKIVFIIFYAAIIYHVAQIVKAKQMKEPRHIAFSGNGSKIIKVLSPDSKILARYTKVIFESVLGKEYEGELDIIGIDKKSNPKEATCKGGLVEGHTDNDDFKTIVLKDSDGNLVSKEDTYARITDDAKKNVVESVKRFFDTVLIETPRNFDLDKNFGVEKRSMEIAMNVCKKDLNTYLDRGLALSIKESGDDKNEIEDAVSFYPIKGVIQALADNIYDYYKGNNE